MLIWTCCIRRRRQSASDVRKALGAHTDLRRHGDVVRGLALRRRLVDSGMRGVGESVPPVRAACERAICGLFRGGPQEVKDHARLMIAANVGSSVR